MGNPTLVVVTDRNDLDGQLFQTFVGAKLAAERAARSRQRPRRAARAAGRPAGRRHHLHTVQKFTPAPGEEQFPRLTDRTNIVVIADEAHRSQYGLRAVLDRKTGAYKYGFAKHLRDALPGATFVGFTGTPVESADKDTRAVFGDYVSIYDIQDAVDDGATVPIYYESRWPSWTSTRRRSSSSTPRWRRSSKTRKTWPSARPPRASGRSWKSWWAPPRACGRWPPTWWRTSRRAPRRWTARPWSCA
jgi:type I site-specific restriction-modification system R (restriction) subunit